MTKLEALKIILNSLNHFDEDKLIEPLKTLGFFDMSEDAELAIHHIRKCYLALLSRL
jgi:hypothetical protein